jgi:L-threonylcarbamoyladenylate synthase
VVAEGGLIAYPTEGVIGLGCDPLRSDAVERLLKLKRRSRTAGLIVIGAGFWQLERFIGPVSGPARNRMAAHWPGPYTFVVPARPYAPRWLTRPDGTIAVRVPGHMLARELCCQCGPLVSTSANRGGRRPARSLREARLRFGPLIDYYVPGRVGETLGPSAIIAAESGQELRPPPLAMHPAR